MSVRVPGRRNRAATAVVAAAVVLAGFAAAGCSHRSATPRASVESCIQFGIEAIRHHVTVTSLPPACLGLTTAQVNFAAGSALHSAASGAGGKARQRERVAKVSHFLQRLVSAVPRQRSQPPPSASAARPAGREGRTALALIAACTWLITVGLGVSMMARWIARGRRRRAAAGQPRRPPVVNLAHAGLATAGLLAWIAYLVTGVIGVAWTACALLPPVAGLGMTLVFLPSSPSPAEGATTGQPAPDGTAAVPAGDDPPRARRPPVPVVTAHIAFATATILFAVLTAIGTS
jgi:hypothetical protein